MAGTVPLRQTHSLGSTIMTLEEGFAPNGYARQPSGDDHPQVWSPLGHTLSNCVQAWLPGSLPGSLDSEAAASSGACPCQVWLPHVMLMASCASLHAAGLT